MPEVESLGLFPAELLQAPRNRALTQLRAQPGPAGMVTES